MAGRPSPAWGPRPGTRTMSHVWTPRPCRYVTSSSEASQAGALSLSGAAGLVSFQAWTWPRCGQQPCDYGFEVMPAACAPSPVQALLRLGGQHPGWHVGGTRQQGSPRGAVGGCMSLSRSALLLCSPRKPHPDPGIGACTHPSQILYRGECWSPAAALGAEGAAARCPGPRPARGSLSLTLQAVPLPRGGFQQE